MVKTVGFFVFGVWKFLKLIFRNLTIGKNILRFIARLGMTA
jgi:hypothetical protein